MSSGSGDDKKRDEVLKRMLQTPPKKHREPGKPSPRAASQEKADKPNERPKARR
jgi:hypothetical protein